MIDYNCKMGCMHLKGHLTLFVKLKKVKGFEQWFKLVEFMKMIWRCLRYEKFIGLVTVRGIKNYALQI